MPWNCFIKRLKIIDICVAPIVSADTCAILKVLIEDDHDVCTYISRVVSNTKNAFHDSLSPTDIGIRTTSQVMDSET